MILSTRKGSRNIVASVLDLALGAVFFLAFVMLISTVLRPHIRVPAISPATPVTTSTPSVD